MRRPGPDRDIALPAGTSDRPAADWDRNDPHAATGGAESFAGLLGRVTDFLARLSALESGPAAVFTHGLFIRAVAWSLLTGITTPDQDQMRSFRRFADRFHVPNASVTELRHADDGTAQVTGCTIHLPAAPTTTRTDSPR